MLLSISSPSIGASAIIAEQPGVIAVAAAIITIGIVGIGHRSIGIVAIRGRSVGIVAVRRRPIRIRAIRPPIALPARSEGALRAFGQIYVAAIAQLRLCGGHKQHRECHEH
jgi:hypothetical protein